MKSKSERQGFKGPWFKLYLIHSNLMGLADVSVSKNHVCLLLLHQVIMPLENFGKTLPKTHFRISIH